MASRSTLIRSSLLFVVLDSLINFLLSSFSFPLPPLPIPSSGSSGFVWSHYTWTTRPSCGEGLPTPSWYWPSWSPPCHRCYWHLRGLHAANHEEPPTPQACWLQAQGRHYPQEDCCWSGQRRSSTEEEEGQPSMGDGFATSQNHFPTQKQWRQGERRRSLEGSRNNFAYSVVHRWIVNLQYSVQITKVFEFNTHQAAWITSLHVCMLWVLYSGMGSMMWLIASSDHASDHVCAHYSFYLILIIDAEQWLELRCGWRCFWCVVQKATIQKFYYYFNVCVNNKVWHSDARQRAIILQNCSVHKHDVLSLLFLPDAVPLTRISS